MLTISRSLSLECTPLKQVYDSCFNSWFEGYLRPVLDKVGQPASYSSPPPNRDFQERESVPREVTIEEGPTVSSSDPSRPERLLTNWSNAFPPSSSARLSSSKDGQGPLPHDTGGVGGEVIKEAEPIDLAGKTRAQIKALEYERVCGDKWRRYNQCVQVGNECPQASGGQPDFWLMQKAIAANSNLSSLLDQARREHPLRDMDHLDGTPWSKERDVPL